MLIQELWPRFKEDSLAVWQGIETILEEKHDNAQYVPEENRILNQKFDYEENMIR